MAVKASATITLSFMVDVKAVFRYYKLQISTATPPSPPTTATPSGWTETEPTYTEGSTNTLYFVDKTVFTNDSFVYSLVSKSTAYEAAKSAYNKAVAANTTATNAQNSIDNLQIGGRNLAAIATSIDGSRVVDNYGYPGYSDELHRISAKIPCSEGDTFTASTNASGNLAFGWINSSGTIFSRPTGYKYVSKGYVQSFTAPSNTVYCAISWAKAGLDGHVKLERGNRATDWTPAPEDVDAAIENVQVGGRNLLLKTNQGFTNWGISSADGSYARPETVRWLNTDAVKFSCTTQSTGLRYIYFNGLMPNYDLLEPGQTYILSYDLNSTSIPLTFHSLQAHNATNALTKTVKLLSNDITAYGRKYVYELVLKDTLTSASQIVHFANPLQNGESVILTNLKLERGNRRTDWSPAPEDVEEQNNSTAATLREEILRQYNNITSEYDEFVSESLKEYVSTDELGQELDTIKTSILDQTSDALSVKFNEVISKTNDVDADMKGRFTQLSKWINFTSDTAITIGSSNSPITLEIDNANGIVFKKDNTVFGYWDGTDFHTGNIVVEVNERAQFGNFAFLPRSDGSLALLKVK